jgi:hypothetical protein
MSDQFPGPGNPNNPPSWGQPGGSVPPPPPGGFPQMGMGMPMGADVAGINSRATQTLIGGIVGLLCCLGWIFALVNGNKVKGEAAAAGIAEPSNNKIGRILGYVGIGLTVLGVILRIAVQK